MEPIGDALKTNLPMRRNGGTSARQRSTHSWTNSTATVTATPATTPSEMPAWHLNARMAAYPDACRAKCEECHGRKSNAGTELEVCQACQAGPAPCKLHKCRACDGSGQVCPYCRGMRFVREREWDTRHGGGYIRVPTKD